MVRGDIQKRKVGVKPEKKTILLVCEGKKDEPKYFDDLRRRLSLNVKIKVKDSSNQHAEGVVQYAINYVNNKYKHDKPDYIWCLFDSDQNTRENLIKARQKAENNDIDIAFSNPCFEVWYYLHFSKSDSPLVCFNTLDKQFKKIFADYDTNPKLYSLLYERITQAISNAQHLAQLHQTNNTPLYSKESDPSTNIHELVGLLLSLKQENSR